MSNTVDATFSLSSTPLIIGDDCDDATKVGVNVVPPSRAVEAKFASLDSLQFLQKTKNPNSRKGELKSEKIYDETMESLCVMENTVYKPLKQTPSSELPSLLEKFFMCVKRCDGSDYNGSSLGTIYQDLARYLLYRDPDPVNIKDSPEFSKVSYFIKLHVCLCVCISVNLSTRQIFRVLQVTHRTPGLTFASKSHMENQD